VFGPTPPAHPFLASSPCQRAENFRPRQQECSASPLNPSYRTPSFRGGRLISKRPARRQPLFFAAIRFPGQPGGEDHLRQSRSRRPDHSVSAGLVFYLSASAPSTSFFTAPLSLQREAEKITSALLPVNLVNTSPRQRGAVSTSTPPRRQPLFSKHPGNPLNPPAKPSLPSAPPHIPDRSVLRGGRFVRPLPAPVKPFLTPPSLFQSPTNPPIQRPKMNPAHPHESYIGPDKTVCSGQKSPRIVHDSPL